MLIGQSICTQFDSTSATRRKVAEDCLNVCSNLQYFTQSFGSSSFISPSSAKQSFGMLLCSMLIEVSNLKNSSFVLLKLRTLCHKMNVKIASCVLSVEGLFYFCYTLKTNCLLLTATKIKLLTSTNRVSLRRNFPSTLLNTAL